MFWNSQKPFWLQYGWIISTSIWFWSWKYSSKLLLAATKQVKNWFQSFGKGWIAQIVLKALYTQHKLGWNIKHLYWFSACTMYELKPSKLCIQMQPNLKRVVWVNECETCWYTLYCICRQKQRRLLINRSSNSCFHGLAEKNSGLVDVMVME